MARSDPPPDAIQAADTYVSQPAPLFARLPLSYRIVPPAARMAFLAARARRTSPDGRFPHWPIETRIDRDRAPGLTYAGRRAAFLLTHDVDSPRDLELLDDVIALDRRIGIISAVGFVPHQSWPSEQRARQLVDDGRELFWHDISHDGRLPYMPLDRIRREFDNVRRHSPWATDLMRAFRSGQLLTSRNLLTAVAERFAIDMSIPDTERHGPYGATAGCGTVFPFRLHGILEIPVTMPQEVFLRHVYRWPADMIANTWDQKLAYIKARGGVATLNIHPVWIARRDPELRAVVQQLLERVVSDPDLLVTTPTGLEAAVSQPE